MANVIDFTEGRNRWGHALHTWTMREIPAEGWLQKLQDRRRKAYRVSMMVHSSTYLKAGDIVKWTRANGGEIAAPIIAVKPAYDPKDMFTLVAYVTPDCRTQS